MNMHGQQLKTNDRPQARGELTIIDGRPQSRPAEMREIYNQNEQAIQGWIKGNLSDRGSQSNFNMNVLTLGNLQSNQFFMN